MEECAGVKESWKQFCKKKWGWIVTIAAFFNFLFTFGLLYSYGLLFLALQKEFKTNTTLTGWVGSIAIGLHTLGSFASNPLIEKFNNRFVALLGIFMCFSSCIITSFMPTITPMFGTFSLLYGFGINFTLISSMSLLLKYYPGTNCSRNTSVALIGTTAGMLMMNPLINLMIENFGWRNMLRIMGGIILMVGIPAGSTYSLPPKPVKILAIDEKTGAPILNSHSDNLNQNQNQSNQDRTEQTPAASNDAQKGDSSPELKRPSNAPSRKVSFADDRPRNIDEENCLMQITETVPEGEEEEDDDAFLPSNQQQVDSDINHIESNPHFLKKKLKGTIVWKILMIIKLPELWFICIALLGCAMTMSFYYISLVNFMNIKGFTSTQSAFIMSVVAVSEVVGKILLAVFGDHLPFAKIWLFIVCSLLGIGIMLSLIYLIETFVQMILLSIVTGCVVMTVFDALPYSICNQVFGKKRRIEAWTVLLCANGIGLILGSLYGESVDQTGSYDNALFLSIGIYAVAFFLFLLIPIYQKCCTRDRFIMIKEKRRRITLADEWGVGRTEHAENHRKDSFMPPPLPPGHYIELESCI